MAYRNDKRDNFDRRTRTSRDASSRSSRQPTVRSQRSRSSRASSGSARSSRAEQAERTTRATRSPRTSRAPRSDRGATNARAQRTQRSQSTAVSTSFEPPEHPQTLFAVPGGRYDGPTVQDSAPAIQQPQLVSTSVGELRRAERAERIRKSSRRYLLRFIVIIGVVVALLAGWAALYNSPAFTIQHVNVNGVEHLTSDEVSQLVNVPSGETLLRVDTETIANRMKKTAWIQDVDVKRVFPDSLEINVTERNVQAVVEIPTSSGSAVKKWAIAGDHIWLMPIPDEGSEAAKTTSAQIYSDAESALHIVDVPYGTKAEIGELCTDGNVNNALDIVGGMTTELASRVVKVSAAGTAETTLILDNGVEIAFGKAEDIRDKERVILKIMEENPDGVAYINVRMVEQPTWRAV